MYSEKIAIRVSSAGKAYRLYAQPHDRLRQFVIARLRRWVRLPTQHHFDEFWALKDVSFEVRRGETLGIIGRNGCGKSTLLQLICGVLQPSAGVCDAYGRVAALLELGAGFNPEFTGRENVRFNAALLGLTPDEIDQRFESIARFADIGDFMDRPTRTYSSGMYVRLAFAVAVHVDADILVIDEALAVGDAAFTQKCMRYLRQFREHGTLVFVSHDSGAVLALCDKALWIDAGEQRAFGPAKGVCEAYLASLHGDATPESRGREPESADLEGRKAALEVVRREIDRSTLRNDLQVFRFDPAASAAFGDGAAEITEVWLSDRARGSAPLAHLTGGEPASLRVRAEARAQLDNPIVGFSFKDRLGQVLFGENTYLACREAPMTVDRQGALEARFDFRMPVLPSGEYTIAVALASGTQENHVQHHWIHDALHVRSVASSASTGLIGIPMEAVSLQALQPTCTTL